MTNKPILGVDLDGVCLDYVEAFREFTAEVLGVDISDIPSPASYSFFESGWGFTSEDHFRSVHGQAVESGLYARLPVMPGAAEALHRLSDAGVHIRIITNRFVNKGQHGTVVAQTAERLETANIPYHDLCFVANKRDVGLGENGVLIDDAPTNVVSVREAGTSVIVFDAPYNKHLDGPRAHNWDEAESLIRSHFSLSSQ